MTAVWMIYGAYGYTGELVAREAVRRGLSPVLAGRDRHRVTTLARELGLESRTFALESADAIGRGLGGIHTVAHCAGPFFATSRPMVEACLETRTHYLDITGEVGVLESVLRQDGKARDRGIALLPGAGFDVVPTDCLAARLAEAVPDSRELTLAFHSEGGGMSRGTLRTALAGLPYGGAVRREGRLTRVPLAAEVREIPFHHGKRWAMTVPWGDLATAFRSTGIPHIRVFASAPLSTIRRLRRWRFLVPLLAWKPLRRAVTRRWTRGLTGPDAETRRRARCWLWGEVRGPDGGATGTLEVAEGYSFTAISTVECAQRIVQGRLAPGAWTPSQAFGAGFVGELPGTVEGPIERSP